MYKDESAIVIYSEIHGDVKIYREAYVKNSILEDRVTIGDYTRISGSRIGERAIIQRRNLVFETEIGHMTSTMPNTVIFNSKIRSYCSISWNTSIGGTAHDYSKITTHGFLSCVDFGMFTADELSSGMGVNLYSQSCTIGSDVWIAAGACVLRESESEPAQLSVPMPL